MKYKEAGVDIETADQFKQYIKKLSNKIGGFGGMFELPSGYKNPCLISSADGVGTKLKIAVELGIHDTVGEDLVNHCINDILTTGALPLYFMDYIGTTKLNIKQQKEVINGIARACNKNNITLLGGETAEMPGFYTPGEYDLVGFITGIVEKSDIIDGKSIVYGDKLIGFPSSGLHTNGYSLVRKIIKDKKLKLNMYINELECELGEELLKIHKSYKDLLAPFLKEIKGLAHITGGGIYGNLPRTLPQGIGAKVYKNSWEILPIFKFIQQEGNVDEEEMFRVFNMGIGMIAIVKNSSFLEGIKEKWIIGETTKNGKIEVV